MAVRCSLLGHAFGDPEVDHKREERGTDVVVTVEEYEVCARCGKRNVLSENTEVKRMADPDDDSDGTPPTPGDEGDGAAVSADTGPNVSTAETAASGPNVSTARSTDDPAPDQSTPAEQSQPTPASGDEADHVPTDELGEPITDDAEILDDAAEDGPDDTSADDASARGHGEWPDSEDVGTDQVEADTEPAAWPDSDDVRDEPANSEGAAEPDTATPESNPQPSDTDETESDSEPADAGESAAGTASVAKTNPTPASGIESAGEAPAPGTSSVRDGVPTVFFCPRCSFVAPSDRASLRAGDICPECKKGYLGERERQ